MVGYIFGGKTGETQDSLKQKRLAALALMQQGDAPKNVGEGLAAVGRALSGRFALNYLDKKDASLKKEGDSVFNALFSGGSSAPSNGSSVPMPGAAAEVSASNIPDLSKNDVYNGFIDTVKGGGVTNPNALAAIAATGQAESGYDPGKVNASWADPSQSGQQGTSGGILSWRNERLANMRNFAQANGEDAKNISPQMQAKFFLQENPQLVTALNAAKTPEEAAGLMANAWKFAGYDQQGGEAARRLGYAKGFVSKFQPTDQVASAAPMTATDAIAAQAPLPGGNDPGINISQRAPMPQGPSPVQTALMQGPQPQAPQLPPPTNVASPPQVAQAAPMPSPQPQQMAQAPQAAPQPSPAQALAAGPTVQQLMVAAQNPNISDEQRGIVNMMLKQKMDETQASNERALKMSDPGYQADLALKQAQLAKIGQEPDSITGLKLRAQEAGLQPGTREYQAFMVSGGKGPLVTVNNGDNSSKFNEESDKSAATRLGTIVEEGNSAPQMMGDLQQLAELGKQIGTGKGAQITAAIGPYAQALGIDVKGLDETQAFTAIVNRIAPQMRPSGAGATSDFDARQFLSSLPSLGNQPGGNELISQTFQAVQQNKIAAAEIASKAQSGEIKWQEAERQIRALPNPYETFKKIRKDMPKAEETKTFQGAPAVGTSEDGFIYQGGDPSDPKSWKQEM